VRVRHAIIALAAAALGVWIAVAVAQGDLRGAGCGPSARAPKHPRGFTGTDETGTGLPGSASAMEPCRRSGGGGPKHHVHHSDSGTGPPGQSDHGGQRGHGRRELRGHKPLTFTFSVRLGHGAGAGATPVTGYTSHISPPSGAPDSCDLRLTRRPKIKSGQVARIHLRPPVGGWCDGRYHVTVILTGQGSQ